MNNGGKNLITQWIFRSFPQISRQISPKIIPEMALSSQLHIRISEERVHHLSLWDMDSLKGSVILS